MKLQLSSKDWQLLSAYLDGQLSSRERAQVEQRLRTNPEYGEALQSLRQNQVMLRSLPRRRAPRNFTLTPDMVAGQRRAFISPLAPMLRFSSALATLFLILTFALQQIPRLSPAMRATTEDAAPEMTTMQEAPAGEPEEAYTLQGEAEDGPPVVYWNGPPNVPYANGLGGAPVDGRGGVGGGDGSGGGGSIYQLPNVFSPPVEISPDMQKGFGGGEGGEPPAPTPEEQATAIAQVPELKGTGPILGVPAEEEAGRLLEPLNEPVRDMAAESLEFEETPGSSLLVVQIGLGLLALITGLAAFFLRRKAAR